MKRILVLAALAVLAAAGPAQANPGQANPVELLYGVWRHQSQTPQGPLFVEVIYQRNGTFSCLTQCGPYAFRSWGTWRQIAPAFIRVNYQNWSPREYGGNPIRMPEYEIVPLKFLDANRCVGKLGEVYYRFARG